jgi:hypothetical protein
MAYQPDNLGFGRRLEELDGRIARLRAAGALHS